MALPLPTFSSRLSHSTPDRRARRRYFAEMPAAELKIFYYSFLRLSPVACRTAIALMRVAQHALRGARQPPEEPGLPRHRPAADSLMPDDA